MDTRRCYYRYFLSLLYTTHLLKIKELKDFMHELNLDILDLQDETKELKNKVKKLEQQNKLYPTTNIKDFTKIKLGTYFYERDVISLAKEKYFEIEQDEYQIIITNVYTIYAFEKMTSGVVRYKANLIKD